MYKFFSTHANEMITMPTNSYHTHILDENINKMQAHIKTTNRSTQQWVDEQRGVIYLGEVSEGFLHEGQWL